MIKSVSDATFEKKILESKEPVVVELVKKECKSCKEFYPIYKQADKDYSGIRFYTLDVEDNKGTAMAYSFKKAPSIMLFQNGEFIDRFSGNLSREKIDKMLEEYVNNENNT